MSVYAMVVFLHIVGALGLFAAQGVNFSHVKPLQDDDPAAVGISSSSGAVALLNRAPHPNAAKVLLNWVLSQEGQASYAELTRHNVRRLDVSAEDRALILGGNAARLLGL